MKKWNCLIYLPEEVGEDVHWISNALEGERVLLLEQKSGQELFRVFSQGIEAGGERLAPENCLMLAGTDASLSLARKWQIASVAFRRENGPKWGFQGEVFVLEDLEGLDHRLLQRRYERYHGIPWTIAETQRCEIRELSLEDVPALYELYEKPHMTDYMEPLYPWEEEIEYQKQYIRYVYHFYEFGMWLIFEKATGRLIGRAGLEPREYPNWKEKNPEEELCQEDGQKPGEYLLGKQKEREEEPDRETGEKPGEYLLGEQKEREEEPDRETGEKPGEYPQGEQKKREEEPDRETGEEPGEYLLGEQREKPDFESVIELGYLIDPDYQRQGYATEVCRQIIQTAKEDYGIRKLHSLIRPGNTASLAVARRLGFRYIGNMHMDGKSFQHYILQ